MDEEITKLLDTLNAAWQRYTRTRGAEQHHAPDLKNLVYGDFIAQWESLSASRLAGRVLVYDSTTETFSLPEKM